MILSFDLKSISNTTILFSKGNICTCYSPNAASENIFEDTTVPKKTSKVQANEVTYELHSLGWKAFQNLCATITSEIWGQTIQAFFDSHDGGRDGAFYGKWEQKNNELYQGSFTVQCKFTSKKDKQLQYSDLSDEIKKAKRLASRGLADNYFLFTNAKLKGTEEEEIVKRFENIPEIKKCTVYGVERITQFIRESSRLRMLVPRIYGLGDLSQILDERAYDQANAILSSFGNDLSKFVITNAYKLSAKALLEHGFVLLLGEPACGKSTIAATLALGALDKWGCSTIKIRNADDFVKHWNPHEPKQFFWVDDAFGATQFNWSMTSEWNNAFSHIHSAIRKGCRVVFTSRDYIYRSARKHLKESALPVIKESQVVINVEELTREEREQILYNHIRLGNQSKKFKKSIKIFLPTIVNYKLFTPEIARRLGDSLFTKNLSLYESAISDFVNRPLDLLCEIIRTLDSNSKATLALVFINSGVLPSPIQMTPKEQEVITILGSSSAGIRESVDALNGSLLLSSRENGCHIWRFKHPTIQDAFATLIAENHEWMDIYLAGTPIEQLFQEVSCGDLGIDGVKVIVPVNRYKVIIERINTFKTTKQNYFENKDKIHRFLAYRCDKNFFELYIKENPFFIHMLNVYSYLYAVSEVDVLVRLHEFNLLPEDIRQKTIATIKDLAVSTPDPGFLRDEIKTLFTKDEFNDIISYIKINLLPNLDQIISDWEFNCNDRKNLEEYFDDLLLSLGEYKDLFKHDTEATDKLDCAITNVHELIDELKDDYYFDDDDSPPSFRKIEELTEKQVSNRSIFDDIDE